MASTGLRLLQRHDRSIALDRRARIGRPATNRRRSSANCPAVAYRSPGSLASALSTIVSRSRGIRRSSWRSGGGLSCSTCSISLTRSDSSNAGRSVNNSYSVAPRA